LIYKLKNNSNLILVLFQTNVATNSKEAFWFKNVFSKGIEREDFRRKRNQAVKV
jgi:hypothetical protein